MTLIVTQITSLGIVFCSDRRLSIGSHRAGEVTKFVPIHSLNAGICYFGAASVGTVQLTSWLQTFIQRSTATTIGDFANSLATQVTRDMLPAQKRLGAGFHIAGYETVQGFVVPTFWHVTNFSGMQGYGYLAGTSTFAVTEDFLQRDVASIPVRGLQSYLSGKHHIYRNGQLFPYTQIASFFGQLRGALPGQNRRQWSIPSSIEDFAQDAEFELIITEQIFRRYSNTQPMGGGIQTHVVLPTGIYKFKRQTKTLQRV